ncbi:MAG: substrate-binding domain-containing protein [Desulfomonile tiedjei]|nr:substrate-binding domain-containing protein [Desulfomonile tiedjei]
MNKTRVVVTTILTVFWICCVTFIPEALAQEKKVIRIGGAGLLSDVVQTYADAYVKEAPSCSFVVTGGTTGLGFQRLTDGELDIAMVTRKITAEETKKTESMAVTLQSRFIGHIGLAVITNIKNPVTELTMEQLAKIFRGDVVNWAEVGGPNEPVRVTVRAVPETGAGVLFQEKVLHGAPYAKDSMVMSSYNTTVTVCSRSYGIGYIPTTTVFFEKLDERGVKLIKIKKDANSAPYQLAGGVSKETSYPISIPFLMYWNSRSDNSCIQGLLGFAEKEAQ